MMLGFSDAPAGRGAPCALSAALRAKRRFVIRVDSGKVARAQLEIHEDNDEKSGNDDKQPPTNPSFIHAKPKNYRHDTEVSSSKTIRMFLLKSLH